MNKLILGDCVEEISKLGDESIDLIIADPPYGNVVKEIWDKAKLASYEDFTFSWLTQCKRVLKDTGSIYVWGSLGDKTIQFHLITVKLLADLFHFKNMVVWSKQRGRGRVRGWLFTREEAFWAVKDPVNYKWNTEGQYSTHKYADCWVKRLKKENNPYKRATNVWTDIDEVTIEQAKTSGGKGKRTTLHPTQKPVKAFERIIKAHTWEGDLVLDPFAGSGTTAVAASNLKRKYIVIEKLPEYFQVMQSRINA